MFEKKNILKTIFIVFAIFSSSFSLYCWQIFKTPNLQADKTEGFYLLIPSNSPKFETVWDSLKKHKVVKDEVSFKFLVKLLKYKENVKAGRYFIHKDMGNYNAIMMLKKGIQTPVKLTFNNIRLKEELIRKVGSKFEFDSTAFSQMLYNDTMCRKYGFDKETIMCMFLPNTYEVFWNSKPEKLFDRMKHEYDKYWTDARKKQAQSIGFTPIQVQILASIVEAETKKNDEKPRVAGTYINRLNIQMPLQADPTVIFALKDFSIKRVLKNQLQVNSPYNTYKNIGLPPGPINLPELSSIEAVLNYERHNYLYFCASPALNGYHVFASDYNDQLKNAQLYQEALNQLGIKK
jgi:UPF0755 protein